MAPQVTGRLGITCIQESANEACPALTFACRTFKDVCLPVLDVLDGREGLEENIYRGIPILLESS